MTEIYNKNWGCGSVVDEPKTWQVQKVNTVNKNVKNEHFEKKWPLDYVLKNRPAKFGDDQSILRHKKLGMMKCGR